MSTSYETLGSLRSFSADAARVSPSLTFTGAYPVVRNAILVKHEPALTQAQTDAAFVAVRDAWREWKRDYMREVARASGVPQSRLAFVPKHAVRQRYDGKTPVVDLPRIGLAVGGNGYGFDHVFCAALCTEDQFSSKLWTRVGWPQGPAACDVEELRAVTDRYRAQAIETGEWFYGEFLRLTRDALTSEHVRESARLEVTTVGLRFEGDVSEDDLDAWLFDGDAPNVENAALWDYVRCAAGIDVTLDQLGKHRWLSMPAAFERGDGRLLSRRVLYLLREGDRVVQIVGIVLDDSLDGELANGAALKLSRFIASGI